VRDIAKVVQDRFPRCEVTYASGAGADVRSYRVAFKRYTETFPDYPLHWDAAAGVAELARAFAEVGLDRCDLEGQRFIRLRRLMSLVDTGMISPDLRWLATRESISS